MIALWIVVFVVGLAVSGFASAKALRAAESLGERAGLSPFIIGLTIVSVGTDLPEIANSISAAAAGRGDLIVGDSTGSAATQITFVLGALCMLHPIKINRPFVASTGAFTVTALLGAAWLMSDGEISHLDGGLLIGAWVFSTYIVGRSSRLDRTAQATLFGPGLGRDVFQTFVAMAVVAGGAVAAVHAFGEITDSFGVPEYVTSFFVLSIGTSLPELFIGVRALGQGSGSLALGDLLGSSLVDATLSLGIGPLIFAAQVSDAAAHGTLLVGGVVAVTTLFLLSRITHGRRSGLVLIGLYLVLFPLLIV